ncbi:MAG: hypothetical protein KDD64_06300 [Bdellovibrionales bacterium]|nr:hypothetical protein [Bdellovibrionales bacterium]
MLARSTLRILLLSTAIALVTYFGLASPWYEAPPSEPDPTMAFQSFWPSRCGFPAPFSDPEYPADALALREKISATIAGLPSDTVKVLFVGSSHTFAHNMPEMVRALFRSRGKNAFVLMVGPGGASLTKNWYERKAEALITAGLLQYVVFQEQSHASVSCPGTMRDGVAYFTNLARQFGAEPLLYMTWFHRYIPSTYHAREMNYVLSALYADVPMAPAGVAWRLAQEGDRSIELLARDGNHGTQAGMYLSALSIYAALSGKSPVGLPASLTMVDSPAVLVTLSDEEALYLQEKAEEAQKRTYDMSVVENLPREPIGLPYVASSLYHFGLFDKAETALDGLRPATDEDKRRIKRARETIEQTRANYHYSRLFPERAFLSRKVATTVLRPPT